MMQAVTGCFGSSRIQMTCLGRQAFFRAPDRSGRTLDSSAVAPANVAGTMPTPCRWRRPFHTPIRVAAGSLRRGSAAVFPPDFREDDRARLNAFAQCALNCTRSIGPARRLISDPPAGIVYLHDRGNPGIARIVRPGRTNAA